MFKKCLIVSVIIHLSLFVGFGLISDHPDNLRAAQERSPLIVATLDSDFPLETPNERVPENDSRKKIDIRSKKSLVNNHREQIAGLSVAEETPPAVSANSEKLKPEDVIGTGESKVGVKDSLNFESSGLAEQGTVGATGNQPSPEANQPDQLPIRIHNPNPAYPLKARENNWEGVSVLKVQVQANGQIGEITVLQSSGYPLLDQAAVKAVKQWRYRPALKNGIAVAWQVRVKIKYVLEGQK